MKPLVSVIMPCYNTADFLQDAIESILHQSYRNFELVIIDDASTDNSLSMMEELAQRDDRIRIIKNERNRGISFSRNQGIINSQGKYIALMDADDIAYPDWMETQIDYLEKHDRIDAVTGCFDIIDMENNIIANNQKIKGYSPEELKVKLLFECVMPDSSTIFRKSVLAENALFFQDEYHVIDAYKFFYVFTQYGNMAMLPRKFFQYRINQNGLTQTSMKIEATQRYEWLDKFHLFCWREKNISLPQKEEAILLKYTRGESIYKIKEERVLEKAVRRIGRQLHENEPQNGVAIGAVIKETVKQTRWICFINWAGLIKRKIIRIVGER